jgi:hypothetical protein
MNEWIAWAGFAGAWLLVAGPLYQAAVELNELEVDRDGMKASMDQTPRPARPSAWWWLLPPVMYVLRRHRDHAYQQAVFAQMTEAQREQFISFKNKAAGWFTVAIGATLLAAGDTWQIVEHHDWPVWVFWLLVAVMLAAAVLNTAAQMISSERHRRQAGAEPATAAERR